MKQELRHDLIWLLFCGNPRLAPLAGNKIASFLGRWKCVFVGWFRTLAVYIHIYQPVVNGGSCSERLGYSYSQEKMGSQLELQLEFPNHLIVYWLVVWNIFIFPYIGNNHPNWLIFFRGVQTTKQHRSIIHVCLFRRCTKCGAEFERNPARTRSGRWSWEWMRLQLSHTFTNPICSMYGIFTYIYLHLGDFGVWVLETIPWSLPE